MGRYSLNKTFTGDLAAESVVDMLSGGSTASAAGAYVAMELVTGTLNGQRGSFLLSHQGFMTKSSVSLDVKIAPGCGTGELQGITGPMVIRIEGDDHFYDLEYEFKP